MTVYYVIKKCPGDIYFTGDNWDFDFWNAERYNSYDNAQRVVTKGLYPENTYETNIFQQKLTFRLAVEIKKIYSNLC